MGLREEIQKKIDKKHDELAALANQARECEVYINSLQDVLKMLPREAQEGKEVILRHGSQLEKARDVLRKAGKPLHVSELLQAMGRNNSKQNRLALSGSLASYVRREEIFTRPQPNTFGLVEFEKRDAEEPERIDLLTETSTIMVGGEHKTKAAS